MALSNETQRWLEQLKAEGGLSEEAYNTLRTTFDNGKVDGFVKGSVLRQEDYSRQMASVKETQIAVEKAANDLKVKEAAVTKYQSDLGQWKAGAEDNYKKALAEREAAERKVAATVGRLRTVGESAGLDVAELLKDLDVVATNPDDKNKNQPTFDASKFVAREDLSKAIAESAIVDASIHDLAIEHQELTGEPLRNARQLVEEAIRAGKLLTTYIAEKFNYADLRTKKQEASVTKRIEEAVAAERTKILSENMLPGNVRPGSGLRDDLKGSPVFSGNLKPPSDEGGGGVSAALAAFNSGKYKGGHTN